MSEFIPVMDVDELPDTGNKAIVCQGQSVLICRSGDEFYALANRCSHQSMPLEGGRVRGHYLSCPVHGARFDLRTGVPKGELTKIPVPVYPLRVIDGRIEISLTSAT